MQIALSINLLTQLISKKHLFVEKSGISSRKSMPLILNIKLWKL